MVKNKVPHPQINPESIRVSKKKNADLSMVKPENLDLDPLFTQDEISVLIPESQAKFDELTLQDSDANLSLKQSNLSFKTDHKFKAQDKTEFRLDEYLEPSFVNDALEAHSVASKKVKKIEEGLYSCDSNDPSLPDQ